MSSLLPRTSEPSRLRVFTFLWACQALVHQEFYSAWVSEGDLRGYVLTAAALAALIRPAPLTLVGLALSSIVYNVAKWPFVVNHIFVESLINVTILLGMLKGLRRSVASGTDMHDACYDTFAPVVRNMFLIVYYFAILAKLNWDFLNVDESCVSVMYGDLARRIPWLPDTPSAKMFSIGATLLVEVLLPLTLTFRRTRWMGIAVGLPFHFVLGLVGHRTFSAMAYVLFSLFCMDELQRLAAGWVRQCNLQWGERKCRQFHAVAATIVVLGCGFLTATVALGHYESGFFPFPVYRVAWLMWIIWSIVLAGIYGSTWWVTFRRRNEPVLPRDDTTNRPGWLYVMALLVICNGMTQYVGLKTETNFTMYSNLRMEGTWNNHMFMPAWRLAKYQDDLVEILETDHPRLQKIQTKNHLITGFEFQRLISTEIRDFSVTYRRNVRIGQFRRDGEAVTDPELARPHPWWQAKLLYFRTVPKSAHCGCNH